MYLVVFWLEGCTGNPCEIPENKKKNRTTGIRKESGSHSEIVEFSSKTADMPEPKARTMKRMDISIKSDNSSTVAYSML